LGTSRFAFTPQKALLARAARLSHAADLAKGHPGNSNKRTKKQQGETWTPSLRAFDD
jgi:hypothetical protein